MKNEKNTCPTCQKAIFEDSKISEEETNQKKQYSKPENIAELAKKIESSFGGLEKDSEKGASRKVRNSRNDHQDIDTGSFKIASRNSGKAFPTPDLEKLEKSEIYLEILMNYSSLKDRKVQKRFDKLVQSAIVRLNSSNLQPSD